MSGCPGWESVNPLCRAGQVLSGAAKSAGNDVFGSIADYFASAASSAVSWLWQQLNTATSIDLTSAGVKSDLIATGAIAAIVALALFLIQIIASAVRQDGGGLARAIRGLGVAFIGAAFAVAATQLVLAAVDALCSGVVQFALGTDVEGLGSKLITASTLASVGNPAALLLISLVLIAATVVVWVALMIRKMLIIVAAAFAPIAFSGAVSDISRAWLRRWIELTAALVFSKLILVIIFMIGLSVLQDAGSSSHSGTTGAITNLVIGALTLLLAGFAPWLAIKMVHFAGDSFHAAHGQVAAASAGARTAVAIPQKVTSVAQRGALAASSAGAAGTTAAGRGTGSTSGGQPKSAPPGDGPSCGPGAAAGGRPSGASAGSPRVGSLVTAMSASAEPRVRSDSAPSATRSRPAPKG